MVERVIEIVEDEEASQDDEVRPIASNTDSVNDPANNNGISDQVVVSDNDVAYTEQDQNISEQSSLNPEEQEVTEAD